MTNCEHRGVSMIGAICSDCKDVVRIIDLQVQIRDIKANTTAMLKALDVYWAMVPEAFDGSENCPYCGKPNKDDWFHETCFEDSWDDFVNARKKVEG